MKIVESDRPLRVIMVGAGGFAGAHLKHLVGRDDVELVAVVSRSERGFPRFQERFGVAAAETWSTDLTDVLVNNAIDAAVVCVPHDQHVPVTKQLLAAGVHVLVEKPFAANHAEAAPLVQDAADNGLQLMVGQCERFDQQLEQLQAIVAAGDIGHVHTGRIDVMQGAETFLPPDHWYFNGNRGGGILASVAVHRIDLIRYLLGPVARVWAHQRTVSRVSLAVLKIRLLGRLRCAAGRSSISLPRGRRYACPTSRA